MYGFFQNVTIYASDPLHVQVFFMQYPIKQSTMSF